MSTEWIQGAHRRMNGCSAGTWTSHWPVGWSSGSQTHSGLQHYTYPGFLHIIIHKEQLWTPKGGVTAIETPVTLGEHSRAEVRTRGQVTSYWGTGLHFPQRAFGWQWRYTKATSHCVRADRRLTHGGEKHFLCNSEAQSLWAVLWAFRGLQTAPKGEKRTLGYTTMPTLFI